MNVKVYHFDAFSKIPNKGNPAGVVLDGDGLTEEQMQKIAEKVGFNETAFPLPSDSADLQIRYFTLRHEINLCGHATMATIFALQTKTILKANKEITIETKAGILPVRMDADFKEDIQITMKQASPQFESFNGFLQALAHSMGIEEKDIDTSFPVVYGSTGTWTLIVPIKRLETFSKMKPTNSQFPSVLKEMPRASIHPICFETYNADANMHARHFSSPYSGTVEDPVTGTASGVMGAYVAEYVHTSASAVNLVVEQGQEIGRDGRVGVSVRKNSRDNIEVEITGSAVYVKEFEVSI